MVQSEPIKLFTSSQKIFVITDFGFQYFTKRMFNQIDKLLTKI